VTTAIPHLQGVFTALVTPFAKDGSLDLRSLEKLIDFQLKAGVHGFVACGSTGEAATLSPQEYLKVVGAVRERTRGVCPCIAGISVSSTAVAVETLRHLRTTNHHKQVSSSTSALSSRRLRSRLSRTTSPDEVVLALPPRPSALSVQRGSSSASRIQRVQLTWLPTPSAQLVRGVR
jgi:hypothetical protein